MPRFRHGCEVWVVLRFATASPRNTLLGGSASRYNFLVYLRICSARHSATRRMASRCFAAGSRPPPSPVFSSSAARCTACHLFTSGAWVTRNTRCERASVDTTRPTLGGRVHTIFAITLRLGTTLLVRRPRVAAPGALCASGAWLAAPPRDRQTSSALMFLRRAAVDDVGIAGATVVVVWTPLLGVPEDTPGRLGIRWVATPMLRQQVLVGVSFSDGCWPYVVGTTSNTTHTRVRARRTAKPTANHTPYVCQGPPSRGIEQRHQAQPGRHSQYRLPPGCIHVHPPTHASPLLWAQPL